MIGRRDFCVSEFRKKLTEKFPNNLEEIEETVEEFKNKTWLSDERYITEFIRIKSQYSGWGPYKISQKLREKGLTLNFITSRLNEEYPSERQREIVTNLAEAKWKTINKKKATDKTAAVQRYLSAKGFEFAVISTVISKLSSSTINLPEDQ